MSKRFFLMVLCAVFRVACQAQVNSIVKIDDTDVRQTENDVEYTRKRVVEILGDKADDEACFVFQVDPNTQLKSFAGTIKDKTGKTIRKFGKSDLRMTEISSEMANGAKTMYLNVAPPSYPVTVTFEWGARMNDVVAAFPAFMPLHDYGSKLEKAHYRISTPSSNPCRIMARNILVAPIRKEEDGQIVTDFTVEGDEAIQRERSAPPFRDLAPMVLVAPTVLRYLGTTGSMETWRDFGAWQYGLLEGRDILPDKQKAMVRQVVEGCRTEREKVDRLYRYLYANTRYVSIQLGIGGYQPATAESVARTGFGDCKALSNYMVAMLREAGMDAFYAAVSTDCDRLYADFPNLNQLNHVIAGIVADGDTLWLECTNARMPAGYIHNSIVGHDALLIVKEGAHIVRLPDRADSLNRQRTDVDVSLRADGGADVEIRQRSECGQYEEQLALMDMDADERSHYVLSQMSVPGARLDGLEVREDTSFAYRPSMMLHAKLSTSRFANVTGARLFVPLNTMKSTYGAVTAEGERKHEVMIKAGYDDEENVTIHLPEGYEVEQIPQSVTCNNELGTFESVCEHDAERRIVKVRQRIVVHKGRYAPSAYDSLLSLVNNARKNCSAKMALIRR